MTQSTLAVNPQPLGIFPLPAGYLLLPPVEGVADVQSTLMQGQIPDHCPESLAFFRLALDGDIDAAYRALAADDSLEAAYNRFVLKSSPEDYATLRRIFKGELRQLLDVAAYTIGYLAMPPRRGEAQDECLALIIMTHATDALERDDGARAIELLTEAADLCRTISPLFAAQIIGTLAQTKYNYHGPDFTLIQLYQDALKLLESSSLAETRAEMWLNLGIVYHDLSSGRRGALLEAVKCYQSALSTFVRDKHPEPYALAQSNLGLAYLSMPLQEAGDQLRMAIAVQSLREALEVYTPETHPEQWASAQLNLANAYQYLPSTHPEENLMQAVDLYEEVLTFRSRSRDPLGYARVLANQGNALAHLGIFDHAVPKLEEARTIFAAHGETDAALSITTLLQQAHFNTNGTNGHGTL
ncbi:MAG: hypothetical protein KDJ65_37520 [Anaerolineae bacterium]|nr:hypothetical protein [Anaerolineae bacterium]